MPLLDDLRLGATATHISVGEELFLVTIFSEERIRSFQPISSLDELPVSLSQRVQTETFYRGAVTRVGDSYGAIYSVVRTSLEICLRDLEAWFSTLPEMGVWAPTEPSAPTVSTAAAILAPPDYEKGSEKLKWKPKPRSALQRIIEEDLFP